MDQSPAYRHLVLRAVRMVRPGQGGVL